MITIITSVFNGAKYLEGLIQSVANQTYEHIQFIVIDAGSTDGSVEILRKNHERIDYWVSERDNGIYDAWNKALSRATGDWICFIGSDDYLLDSGTIATMVPNLVKAISEGHTLVYGKNHYLDQDENLIAVFDKPWEQCRDHFSKEMTLAHCGALHHKSMFERNGTFNASFKIAGDYEFLLREYRINRDFAMFADVPVVAMRAGGISGNLKTRMLMANETDLARKINGFTSISFPILFWKLRITIYMVFRKIVGASFANRMADFYRGLKGENKRWSQ